MRLLVSTQARRDIQGAWVYLAEKSGSLEIAGRFLNSIERALLSIQRTPGIGRSRDEDLKQGLRSLPAGKYLIFYRVGSSAVQIIRVLHGNRDIDAIIMDE